MKTYQAVRAEIAKLEQKAEALRQSELKAVIAQLKKTIAEYGLTASELGLGRAPAAAPKGRTRGAKRRAASVGAAKYRDPVTGQTWTGHGRPPAWIAQAKDRSAFLLHAEPAAAAPAKKARATKAAKAVKAKPANAAAKPVKRAAAKRGKAAASRKKAASRAVKTPAVQIESGVVSE